MVVEQACGGRCWEVALEGSLLRIGGLELDLEALSGPESRMVAVYAGADGAPTLEATDWLGAEVLLPGRPLEAVPAGEQVYEDEEGQEVRTPVYEYRMAPLNLELVQVRLFGLPPQVGEQGGEG